MRNINDELERVFGQLRDAEGELFVVDFPDAITAKILADRWLHTANLLGISYHHTAIPFGDGKYHYEANAVGNPEDLAKLSEFIEESLYFVGDRSH